MSPAEYLTALGKFELPDGIEPISNLRPAPDEKITVKKGAYSLTKCGTELQFYFEGNPVSQSNMSPDARSRLYSMMDKKTRKLSLPLIEECAKCKTKNVLFYTDEKDYTKKDCFCADCYVELYIKAAFVSDNNGDTLCATQTETDGELFMFQLTHDVDPSLSLVIGDVLRIVYSDGGWSTPLDAESGYLSETTIDPDDLPKHIETFKQELANIEKLNPQLYTLLKSRKPKLYFVQDDCSCCS